MDSNGKIWCLRRLVKEEVLDGAFQHPYNQILSISGPVTVAFPTLLALAKTQKRLLILKNKMNFTAYIPPSKNLHHEDP